MAKITNLDTHYEPSSKQRYDANYDRIFGIGYEEVPPGSHIWLVTKDLEDYFPGWYYSDELEQFNGPFNTKEEAEQGLSRHVDWLEGGCTCRSSGAPGAECPVHGEAS